MTPLNKRISTLAVSPVGIVVVLFFLWQGALYASALLGISLLPLDTEFAPGMFPFRSRMPYLIWIWGNFDGQHYMSIAHEGYNSFEHSFFPLYPFIIRVAHHTFDLRYLVIGQVISRVLLLLGFLVSYELLIIEKKERLWTLFVLSVFLFPSSLFLASVYNDALFFLLATTTLLFARKRQFLLSIFCASLATFTRLNGLMLIFPIAIEVFATQEELQESEQWNWKEVGARARRYIYSGRVLDVRLASLIFIPLSFVAYLIYTHYVYADWRLVFTDMSIWGRNQFTIPLQVFWRYMKIFVRSDTSTLVYWVAVSEFLFVLLYIALLVYSFCKIRLSYWIFFLISILLPMTTGTFQGMARYGLHLFPLFLSSAMFFDKRTWYERSIIAFISLVLLIVGTVFFTRGYFIA